MALTDTHNESETEEAEGAGPQSAAASVDAVLGNGDHKTTGRFWMVASAIFFVAGAIVSVAAAVEHADLAASFTGSTASDFAQVWSAGRTFLLFGAVVPFLVGLAVYLVPLQVGASSLAFPRGAAAASWTWLLGTLLLAASYLANGGPGGGRGDMVALWAASLGLVIFALGWALVCIASTILDGRAAGMGLGMVPVSAWSMLLFALVGLVSLPIVAAELILAYIDVTYGFLGDSVARLSLVGVMDSATLAPSVYWLALPTLGIALEAVSVMTGRPLRFHRSALVSLAALSVLSFGYEFFSFLSRGRSAEFDNGLYVVALLTAILPVSSALGLASDSVKSGSVKLRTPLLGAFLSGLLIFLGALTAALLVIWPIVGFINDNFNASINLNSALDLGATSIHEGVWGLVISAAALAMVTGGHLWGHKIWGRSLDDRLGVPTAALIALGGALWAVGMVVAAFLGQPRLPVIDADAASDVQAMNVVAAVGVGLIALGGLVFVANLLKTAVGGGTANEPWQGATLEWATTSPPSATNFAGPVVVEGSAPLVDGYRVITPVGSDPLAEESAADEQTEERA